MHIQSKHSNSHNPKTFKPPFLLLFIILASPIRKKINEKENLFFQNEIPITPKLEPSVAYSMKKNKGTALVRTEVSGAAEFGGMSLLRAGEGNACTKRERRKHV